MDADQLSSTNLSSLGTNSSCGKKLNASNFFSIGKKTTASVVPTYTVLVESSDEDDVKSFIGKRLNFSSSLNESDKIAGPATEQAVQTTLAESSSDESVSRQVSICAKRHDTRNSGAFETARSFVDLSLNDSPNSSNEKSLSAVPDDVKEFKDSLSLNDKISIKINKTKSGRRRSTLGRNVVYLVTSDEDSDLKDDDSFAKFSTRKKKRGRKPVFSDSDASVDELDASISLDTIKKSFHSVRKTGQRILSESSNDENSIPSDDDQYENSFVVSDDNDESSGSSTDEAEYRSYSGSDYEESSDDESDNVEDESSHQESSPEKDSCVDETVNNDVPGDSASEEERSPAKPERVIQPKKHIPKVSGVTWKPESEPVRIKTFLQSLSSDVGEKGLHPEAYKYLKNFGKYKQELAERLFALYNHEVFGDELPKDTEIFWSGRLVKTAGRCHCIRKMVTQRLAKIELSSKVIDCCDRLRDTLIHEMCHQATWVISNARESHGPVWKKWGQTATKRFPELPCIARCHTYEIRTKYIYQCENCSNRVGRHSKSVDTDKKVCGRCKGRLQLLVASRENGKYELKSVTQTPKTPNRFAIFVKENYKTYRTPGSSHKDAMALLSQKFAETKLS